MMRQRHDDSDHPGMDTIFTKDTYKADCDILADRNPKIKTIIQDIGYPPFWERSADFDGLVRIILEQQVSLASAYAVYKKLLNRIDPITPRGIIGLSEIDFKSCGFSRQKMRYVTTLAREVVDHGLALKQLKQKSNGEIRTRLKAVTGIGDWTADIYLLMGLNRIDIFPVGDLALRKSLISNGFARQTDSRATLIKKTDRFSPYRSILTMILWHAYIIFHNIKVQ